MTAQHGDPFSFCVCFVSARTHFHPKFRSHLNRRRTQSGCFLCPLRPATSAARGCWPICHPTKGPTTHPIPFSLLLFSFCRPPTPAQSTPRCRRGWAHCRCGNLPSTARASPVSTAASLRFAGDEPLLVAVVRLRACWCIYAQAS